MRISYLVIIGLVILACTPKIHQIPDPTSPSEIQKPAWDFPRLNIMKAGKTYHYESTFLDFMGDEICKRNLDLIAMGKTGKDQSEFPSNFIYKMYPTEEDSIRVYEYAQKEMGRKWVEFDTTSAQVTPMEFSIPAPFENQYFKNKIAVHPVIKFPIEENRNFKQTVYIKDGFGKWNNSKTVTEVEYIGLHEMKYNFGKYLCHGFNAISENDKMGWSAATYYFNDKFGFTEMYFLAYDETIINIKMLGIENVDN